MPRFFDEKSMETRFTKMDTKTGRVAIEAFIDGPGIDSERCVGQEYCDYSTMAGKKGGVQVILQFTKELYCYCSSHKLNLVVNATSHVTKVESTLVKNVISLFLECG